MPLAHKDECKLQDRTKVHGEMACTEDKCMFCTDGKWQETHQLFIL